MNWFYQFKSIFSWKGLYQFNHINLLINAFYTIWSFPMDSWSLNTDKRQQHGRSCSAEGTSESRCRCLGADVWLPFSDLKRSRAVSNWTKVRLFAKCAKWRWNTVGYATNRWNDVSAWCKKQTLHVTQVGRNSCRKLWQLDGWFCRYSACITSTVGLWHSRKVYVFWSY